MKGDSVICGERIHSTNPTQWRRNDQTYSKRLLCPVTFQDHLFLIQVFINNNYNNCYEPLYFNLTQNRDK
ncbi:hypothetical protein C0J52_10564 [Blattella germanica]|nr:hypothetical protein C0J52_10564 [Blattella germanica]